jgi:hypothetical protein
LDLLPAYAKKSVHSTLVTTSSLYFIQCTCRSRLPLSSATIQSYVSFIENSITKNIEFVQQVASEAIGALSKRTDLSPYLEKWIENISKRGTFVVRRGWSMALGYISLPDYNRVLSALCDTIENDIDIETKRNSIMSINLIFSKMEICKGIFLYFILMRTCTGPTDMDFVDQLFG